MKYKFNKVFNTSEIEVALAAPMSPNPGIKMIFKKVFKITHTKLSLNAIWTFPILERHDPTELNGA